MSLWDSIELGRTHDLGSYEFTSEAIIAFAEKYDPQRFHLDPEAAKKTLLGGHCASGWHTAAVYMKLNVAWRKRILKEWLAAGHSMPKFGPSPGIKSIRWPHPVFAGDWIAYSHRVSEKRVSRSRPGWGIIGFAVEAVNQDGVSVMTFDGAAFLGTD
ncbi:Acyl dehydratase [Fulvimarina manganoxydans]|uniref:Acyl dehydratase n=1 Tax=Fulvimarina manganoxydans TaxID=937218 RepID=A0A1W2AHS1_9HYPH|nr:MaoC family dehydratase [Fulvimarina manganoxydans]SMC60255.1 Acyl dehydratase [Fulvimarina manganoxydans]